MRTLHCFKRSLISVFLVSLSIIAFGPVTAAAQQLILELNQPSGIYVTGEERQVQVTAPEGTDSIRVTIRENFYGEETIELIPYTEKGQVIFAGAYETPTAVTFHVLAGEVWAAIGAVVDPAGFEPGMNRPKDFKRFWKQEKKDLRALPMEVKTLPVPDVEDYPGHHLPRSPAGTGAVQKRLGRTYLYTEKQVHRNLPGIKQQLNI